MRNHATYGHHFEHPCSFLRAKFPMEPEPMLALGYVRNDLLVFVNFATFQIRNLKSGSQMASSIRHTCCAWRERSCALS